MQLFFYIRSNFLRYKLKLCRESQSFKIQDDNYEVNYQKKEKLLPVMLF